jgi:hypothetical protein
MQQFHRSPQMGLTSDDDSADLIEVAIPLSELGGLLPGEEIRIAALAGGASMNEAAQRRFIDSSGLATTQSGHGLEQVCISGVRVRLAHLPNLDSDQDGLFDSWEETYGLNPLSSAGPDGAEGDPDGDGMTNSQEQIAGTSPVDSGSVLKLTLTRLLPQRLMVSWLTVPGRKYQLEYADDQLTNFLALPGPDWPKLALSTNDLFLEDITTGEIGTRQRSYRLRLIP